MKGKAFTSMLLLLIFFTVSCGTTSIPEASTATSLPPPTDTPVPSPTKTSTPEPTLIPGVETIPLSEFKHGVPWLPLDEDNQPMSIYYGFNVKKAPFDDLLVRKAFVAALSKEAVAEAASDYYFRDVKGATNLTPPSVLGRDLFNEVGIPYDPDQAKAYLAEAGYPDGEGLPPVTLWVYQRSEKAPSTYYRISVDVIVPIWKEVLGVDVTVKSIDQFVERITDDPPELYLIGWGADYVDPENFLGMLFSTGGEFNFGGYSNADFDQLVEKASTTHDIEKKQALYIQAEQILCEQDVALVPLFHSYFFTEY